MPRKKTKGKKSPWRPMSSDERQRLIAAIRDLNPQELNDELRKTGILSIHAVQAALLSGNADAAMISAAALGAKMGGIIVDKQEVKTVGGPLEKLSDKAIRELLDAKRAREKK